MSESHCPLCDTALAVRDVAPCVEGGQSPEEFVHLAEGRHTDEEVETVGARAVLRDF